MKFALLLFLTVFTSFAFAQEKLAWKFSVTDKYLDEKIIEINEVPKTLSIRGLKCTIHSAPSNGKFEYRTFTCLAGEAKISKLSTCWHGTTGKHKKFNYQDEVQPVRIDYKGQSLNFLLYCE